MGAVEPGSIIASTEDGSGVSNLHLLGMITNNTSEIQGFSREHNWGVGHGHQNALCAEPRLRTIATAHLGAAFRFVAMSCNTNGENCSKSLKSDLFFFQNSSVLHSMPMPDLI